MHKGLGLAGYLVSPVGASKILIGHFCARCRFRRRSCPSAPVSVSMANSTASTPSCRPGPPSASDTRHQRQIQLRNRLLMPCRHPFFITSITPVCFRTTAAFSAACLLAAALMDAGRPLIPLFGMASGSALAPSSQALVHLARWNGPAVRAWHPWQPPQKCAQGWLLVVELVCGPKSISSAAAGSSPGVAAGLVVS